MKSTNARKWVLGLVVLAALVGIVVDRLDIGMERLCISS